MYYISLLSDKEIRSKVNEAVKGNRLRLFFSFLINFILTLALIGGNLYLLYRLHLITPLPSFDSLILNFSEHLRRWVTGTLMQAGYTNLAVAGIALVISIFILIHLWQFGANWATLEMVDDGKFQYRKTWSGFRHRPIRHFIQEVLAGIIRVVASGVFLGGAALVAFFLRVTFLTTSRPTISPSVGLVVDVLAVVLAILILLVGGCICGWFYFGFSFTPYPSYDNEQTGIWRSLRMSWQMMRGNKLRLFKLRLNYVLYPVMFSVLANLALSQTKNRLPDNQIYTGLVALVAIISAIWLFWMLIKGIVLGSVYYRDLTGQYARRLNANFAGFGAKVKPELTAKYRTEGHPTFSTDTQAIHVPDKENQPTPQETETGTTTEHKVNYDVMSPGSQSETPPQTNREEEGEDEGEPGTTLQGDQVDRPIPAKSIFYASDEGKSHSSSSTSEAFPTVNQPASTEKGEGKHDRPKR